MRERLIIFNAITNVFIIFVMVVGGVVWADSNGVWHRAEDVVAGVFGGDEGDGNFVFPQDLEVQGSLCIDAVCKSQWDEVVSSAQTCDDLYPGENRAVVGFAVDGTVICDFPYARYR